METLQDICCKFIGSIGHVYTVECFEGVSIPVLENMIWYLAAETLNRVTDLLYKHNIDCSEVWKHLVDKRWPESSNLDSEDSHVYEFLEFKPVVYQHIYCDKHFRSILCWMFDKHSNGISPHVIYRCPFIQHINHRRRNKNNLYSPSQADINNDLKVVIPFIKYFSIHGRYSCRMLNETFLLELLQKSVRHIEIFNCCEINFNYVLKLLKQFMSHGCIQNVTLCHILLSKPKQLQDLLYTCAGYCDSNKDTDTNVSLSLESSDNILDLLDEALISDKNYNKTTNYCDDTQTQMNPVSNVTALSMNKYGNTELLNVLFDVLPYWTHLRKLSVYGMAVLESDERLVQCIVPLIRCRQLTHLCLNTLSNSGQLAAVVLLELIKAYSNNNRLDVGCYEPLQVVSITTSVMVPNNLSPLLKSFQNYTIPDICNVTKCLVLHTKLFAKIGFCQLFNLIKSNKILESLDLNVFDIYSTFNNNSSPNKQLLQTITDSCSNLHTLTLSYVNIASIDMVYFLQEKSTLVNLTLTNCKFDLKSITPECKEKFLYTIANHLKLKKLILSSNYLGETALEILEAILKGAGCLQYLDIRFNSISLEKILTFLTRVTREPIQHKLQYLYMAEQPSASDNVNKLSKDISAKCKSFVQKGVKLRIRSEHYRQVEYVAMM